MAEHTHESDKALWLNATYGCDRDKLKPGELLSAEDRAWAQDAVWENERQEHRERMEMKCR